MARYMMATKSVYPLGEYVRETPGLCVITTTSIDGSYFGYWTAGAGHVGAVTFPRETTRDLTEEEMLKYRSLGYQMDRSGAIHLLVCPPGSLKEDLSRDEEQIHRNPPERPSEVRPNKFPRFMMATVSYGSGFGSGDMKFEQPRLCCVQREETSSYIGHWVATVLYGSEMVEFPKETTREPTSEEWRAIGRDRRPEPIPPSPLAWWQNPQYARPMPPFLYPQFNPHAPAPHPFMAYNPQSFIPPATQGAQLQETKFSLRNPHFVLSVGEDIALLQNTHGHGAGVSFALYELNPLKDVLDRALQRLTPGEAPTPPSGDSYVKSEYFNLKVNGEVVFLSRSPTSSMTFNRSELGSLKLAVDGAVRELTKTPCQQTGSTEETGVDGSVQNHRWNGRLIDDMSREELTTAFGELWALYKRDSSELLATRLHLIQLRSK